MTAPEAPRASVVIPAHDEEGVIVRCLRAVLDGTRLPLEVVVVANGCTDGTVAAARSVPGVQVIDLPTPSKVAALNAGDAAATCFPRIYLDADIVLAPGAMDALVAALPDDRVAAAAPAVSFRTERSTWPVRAFYSVFQQLPYVRDNLLGLGVYGLSRAARDRFDAFPDVLGDDLYVQRLFTREERVVVGSTFAVHAPRTLRNLLKVRVRIARGNAQLAAMDDQVDADLSPTTASTGSAIVHLVLRDPRMAPAVAVYVAVTVAARALARRHQDARWERDTSTR